MLQYCWSSYEADDIVICPFIFSADSLLDRNLLAGKQQISSLLEKLTLLSSESNNHLQSRYVSGCSTGNDNGKGSVMNIDTEAIFKELDCTSRPNIQSVIGFSNEEMRDIYGSLEDLKTEDIGPVSGSNSDTSLITNFSDCRLAPDGQGNTSDENIVQFNKNS